MGKLIDLTGQRFGELVVLEKDQDRKTSTGSYWKCQCNCGNIISVRSAHLRQGKIKSCGCYRKKFLSQLKTDNLVGQRFGYLTVIEKSENRSNDNRIKWKCLCDCGKITEVLAKDLKRQHTLSCGCKHFSAGELIINNILLENNIEFISQYRFNDFRNHIFDFAIFNHNNEIIQLIEFDGEQHFYENNYFNLTLQEQQKRYQEKNEYAKLKNIPLKRIPFTQKSKLSLELILTKEVLQYYGKQCNV